MKSVEVIGPVVQGLGLPRSRLIVIAFVLASVVFLPVEFPAIDSLLAVDIRPKKSNYFVDGVLHNCL